MSSCQVRRPLSAPVCAPDLDSERQLAEALAGQGNAARNEDLASSTSGGGPGPSLLEASPEEVACWMREEPPAFQAPPAGITLDEPAAEPWFDSAEGLSAVADVMAVPGAATLSNDTLGMVLAGVDAAGLGNAGMGYQLNGVAGGFLTGLGGLATLGNADQKPTEAEQFTERMYGSAQTVAGFGGLVGSAWATPAAAYAGGHYVGATGLKDSERFFEEGDAADYYAATAQNVVADCEGALGAGHPACGAVEGLALTAAAIDTAIVSTLAYGVDLVADGGSALCGLFGALLPDFELPEDVEGDARHQGSTLGADAPVEGLEPTDRPVVDPEEAFLEEALAGST
jgi:hypothetical protein